MTDISIHPKKLEAKFLSRDPFDGYILRIDHERKDRAGNQIITDVIAFEWHTVVSYNALGKSHVIYGMKAPVRQVWEAIDAFGKPDKVVRTDGTKFWVMNAYYNNEGKIDRLEGGNSSPFTIISRTTPLSKEEI
ncbi:hypothetical protein P10VF_159 [Rhizobium phage vB_RleM_P10VF]|uniref:Uncharacterized protein n=1 Tax=Rhizobium phage vB_RleM_P10VF TaxID=1527770 RepID=A0A076YKQ5_9CAUD|nr:hypothetical protein P10VF_159 [Rhizobium phage vB_RleM_P10VF]AIK68372.1 hypothetical protein P10VF_159 [Rhizobium phage vB_RleM_P10VF]